MSERNGDRARFQKNRKRKLYNRQRIRAFVSGLLTRTSDTGPSRRSVTATRSDTASAEAPREMQDEGGPMRAGD
jgi:hypothetical protein